MTSVGGAKGAPTGVVCVGASAGGVDALRDFVSGFDRSFTGAVLVVLHVAASAGSALDRILARSGAMPTLPARNDEPMGAGVVYVARPDHHLMVDDGRIHLSHGPRENGVRPALDPLFRSSAGTYGERSIGVVLSGTGDDGTSGLGAIKAAGGVALVQDPAAAPYRDMPTRAIEAVDVDLVASPRDLAVEATKRMAAFGERNEVRPLDLMNRGGAEEVPSEFTCPDCGGTLFDHSEGGIDRFVCRVGHAYSPESLLEHKDENLENVLWSAVVAFEERADVAGRIMDRLRRAGLDRAADRYQARIDESMRQGAHLREFLLQAGDEREAAGE